MSQEDVDIDCRTSDALPVVVTMEMIHGMPHYYRRDAIRAYHEWLRAVRKQDKLEMVRLRNRLWRFNNQKGR